MTSFSKEIKYKTLLLLTLFVGIFCNAQEVVVGKINPVQGNATLMQNINEHGQASIFVYNIKIKKRANKVITKQSNFMLLKQSTISLIK